MNTSTLINSFEIISIIEEIKEQAKQEIKALLENELNVMRWEYSMLGKECSIPDGIIDRFYVECLGSGLSLSINFGFVEAKDAFEAKKKEMSEQGLAVEAAKSGIVDSDDVEDELSMIFNNVKTRSSQALADAIDSRSQDIKNAAIAQIRQRISKEMNGIAN